MPWCFVAGVTIDESMIVWSVPENKCSPRWFVMVLRILNQASIPGTIGSTFEFWKLVEWVLKQE